MAVLSVGSGKQFSTIADAVDYALYLNGTALPGRVAIDDPIRIPVIRSATHSYASRQLDPAPAMRAPRSRIKRVAPPAYADQPINRTF